MARAKKRQPRRLIAVEGAAGTGKTAVARALAERLRARLVLEPEDTRPFVGAAGPAAPRGRFQTQLYVLLTRFQQQRGVRQPDLFSAATVVDYLFEKDRLFAGLNLDPEELRLYEHMYAHLNAQLAKPDLVVYLRADPEVLRQRLRRSARPSERGLSLEEVERMSAVLNDYFFYYRQTPLLVVNTSGLELPEDEGHLGVVVDQIEKMGKGLQHVNPFVGS